MPERVRTLNEGLVAAPRFTPHRANVVASDPAIGDAALTQGLGIASNGYQSVVANIVFAGTTTGCTAEILFWSPGASAFLKQEPVVSFSLTASRSVRFQTDGRQFFVHLSSVAGASPQVGVEVAGAVGPLEEFA